MQTNGGNPFLAQPVNPSMLQPPFIYGQPVVAPQLGYLPQQSYVWDPRFVNMNMMNAQAAGGYQGFPFPVAPLAPSIFSPATAPTAMTGPQTEVINVPIPVPVPPAQDTQNVNGGRGGQ